MRHTRVHTQVRLPCRPSDGYYSTPQYTIRVFAYVGLSKPAFASQEAHCDAPREHSGRAGGRVRAQRVARCEAGRAEPRRARRVSGARWLVMGMHKGFLACAAFALACFAVLPALATTTPCADGHAAPLVLRSPRAGAVAAGEGLQVARCVHARGATRLNARARTSAFESSGRPGGGPESRSASRRGAMLMLARAFGAAVRAMTGTVWAGSAREMCAGGSVRRGHADRRCVPGRTVRAAWQRVGVICVQ